MNKTNSSLPQTVLQRVSPGLERQLVLMASNCASCGACVSECAFLRAHGSPCEIAMRYDPDNLGDLTMAFACHLCGLCDTICPENVTPTRLFLEMRREAVARWQGDFPQHKRILEYEARGASPRFSLCALPEECDTVFFPGCALPGSNPAALLKLLEWLEKHAPEMGVVLDCCSKPSHDLGRQLVFQEHFLALREMLLQNGVRHVLTACPSCFSIFEEYGKPLEVRMVYEFLRERWSPSESLLKGSVVMHDPCPLRHRPQSHGAVRDLVRQTGLRFEETPHQRENSICCGEGGAVRHMAPEFAEEWTAMRREEAKITPVIAYCAGCVQFLKPRMRAHHILDLLFFPKRTMAGRDKISSAPFTYVNRLRLKAKLKKRPRFSRFPVISRPET